MRFSVHANSWPWLGSPLMTLQEVMYFRFCEGRHVFMWSDRVNDDVMFGRVWPVAASVGGSIVQTINCWWCHDTGCPLLAAEHLLCRVRPSGTLCLMTFVHSRTMCPSNGAWTLACSLVTGEHSALETVTMRYTNLLLALLGEKCAFLIALLSLMSMLCSFLCLLSAFLKNEVSKSVK